MLELDVTHMMDDSADMIALSGSMAEWGPDAGLFTWRNSCEYAAEHPLLTPDQLDEARDYLRGMGAWDDAEIDAWTADEIQALICQDIASNIREMTACGSYEEYESAANKGRVSGLVYRGDDGRYYASLSH